MKIKTQTMQQDLARLKGLKPQKEAFDLPNKKTEKKIKPIPAIESQPPKNLPVSKKILNTASQPKIKTAKTISEEKPKPIIKEKIIEKPVVKWKEKIIEKPVVKWKEKIIKVPDQEQISALKKEYEKKLSEAKAKYQQKSPEKTDHKRSKQLGIILVTLILFGLIGATGYYLFNLEGNKIEITNPQPIVEPEIPQTTQPKIPETPLKPQIQALVPIDDIHISLVSQEPELNLPFYFATNQKNVLKFSDNKLGLVIQVNNNLSTLAEITIWEKTMPQDLANLFLGSAPQAKFKINNWEFPNLIIRYQNTKDLENSIHYALVKDRLVITTSATNMSLLLNNLWISN